MYTNDRPLDNESPLSFPPWQRLNRPNDPYGLSGGSMGPILMVAPDSPATQHAEELHSLLDTTKFEVSSHPTIDFSKANRQSYWDLIRKNKGGVVPFIIMTESELKADFQRCGGMEEWSVFSEDHQWSMTIIDEAHSYRSPKPTHQLGQALAKLSTVSKWRWLMTATPVWSSPVDIWHILKRGGYKADGGYFEDLEKRFQELQKVRRTLQTEARRVRKNWNKVHKEDGAIAVDVPPNADDHVILNHIELPEYRGKAKHLEAWQKCQQGIVDDVLKPIMTLLRPNIVRRTRLTELPYVEALGEHGRRAAIVPPIPVTYYTHSV
jgi:hypothetical protein